MRLAWTIVCLAGMLTVMSAGALGQTVIDVAGFDSSAFTAQGGLFTCIGGKPDRLRDRLTTKGNPAGGAWLLELTADAPGTGVGCVIPLIPHREKGNTLKLNDVSTLYVRALGQLGDRTIKIELLPHLAEKHSGILLGSIDADGLDADSWRVIGLPLAASHGKELAFEGIRITAEGEGTSQFALNAIWFGNTEDSERSMAPTAVRKPLRKAMWVWKSKEILASATWPGQLLSFCKTQGITDIFWQVPNRKSEGGERGFWYVNEQRAFNAQAHKAGISMHALDGDPEFVWKKNHHRVFELVDALGRFNHECKAEERYVAVHMDNEPYVLKEWKASPESQQEIIRDYLSLNRELRRRVNAAGMEYGVDIPFWWDSTNDEGERVYYLQTESGREPLLEAIFELVQNAGIMSYRVRATGGNGVLDCCLTEFDLGARMGVDVLASVETAVGPRVETGITFGVYSCEYLLSQLETLERLLALQKGCAGLAIHDYYSFAGMLEKTR